jgi:2-polyprenyl-3-methyl-5-hydroxy-6-metoxy-1,4-benzoquinol methylase
MPSLEAGELEWYLRHARETGGPILELACGSGRLLIPIAEAGYEIDGVDVSQAMIQRLEEKVEPTDLEIRARIRCFCCDMVAFEPERRYAMAFIGLN